MNASLFRSQASDFRWVACDATAVVNPLNRNEETIHQRLDGTSQVIGQRHDVLLQIAHEFLGGDP
jgi:hypothetical protein